MDDRMTVKQLASARLQKAINKNQTFDLELKKELQVLEIKKKASEKAFEQRRTQFLKTRLCVEPLKKSQSCHRSNGPEKWRHERTKAPGLLDLRTCYSTGNLLESLLSSRKDPSCRNESPSEENAKPFKKFSLDWGKDASGKQKSLKNCCKSFSEPNNWSDEIIGANNQGTTRNHHHISGTCFETLTVPCFGKKLSLNDDNLTDNASGQGKWVFKRRERLKSWDASSRLTIPNIAKSLSKSGDESLLRSDENVTKPKRHLSLPPLRRTRSKSVETLRVLPENETEIKSGSKYVNDTSKLSWTDVPKIHRAKKSSWVSGSVEQEPWKKQEADGNEVGETNLELKKMDRSKSTPDLLDIEPEVEYLLLKDDKIRLQRMRVSLDAVRLMGDMKEYRYIRNVEYAHQKNRETNPQTDKVSGNHYPDHAQMHRTESETFVKTEPQATQNISTMSTDVRVGEGLVNGDPETGYFVGGGVETSEATHSEGEESDAVNDTSTDEQSRLNSSTASSLAEMFDEIKHTRYLRIRPRMSSGDSGDDGDDDCSDDDGNSCNMSYGYRVPLIIVGHTKAVMTPEES